MGHDMCILCRFMVTVRDIRDSYKDGLERGLPRPILHSLEYFYVDGGGLRWHRALRNAGHFTYILLW